MIDYHIHSAISADCDVSMKRMADAAQKKGLKEICFTEHIDLGTPNEHDFLIDFDAYNTAYELIKQSYPDMTIRKGIEAGLDIHTKDEMIGMLDGADYVIGSQHLVYGLDPYYKELWQSYTRKELFDEYLNVTIESIKHCGYFDVLGHLGYISKFCPHDDKLLRYSEYADEIDTILKLLIAHGKGLEINTNGLYMTPSTMPETAIVQRYFELGGEIITVGSDAHNEQVVGHAIAQTLDTLKRIGFKYVCAFDQRIPRFIPIP